MERHRTQLVRSRAGDACEYCRLPVPRFHIEHIVARQHGGLTVETNLALACVRCNYHKGPNLSGVDPESQQVIRLFHPRLGNWADHFRWDGPTLVGITAEGRATIAVLDINDPVRVELRTRLILEGMVLRSS